MMESTQRRAEQAAAPLQSATGDMRRARSAGAASVQELKAFLQQHRGKSSQELLGELGKSSLFEAMLKSTLGTLVLLGVLTIVPYATQGEPQPKKSKTTQKNAAAAASTAATPAPAAAQGTTAATKNGAPNGVDLEKAQKVMGLDETRPAPANVNPRDKHLDNLLARVTYPDNLRPLP